MSLEELDLSYLEWDDADIGELRPALSWCVSLLQLYLQHNKIFRLDSVCIFICITLNKISWNGHDAMKFRYCAFNIHQLDTDTYTYKEPEQDKNGDWGFSILDKNGDLVGSYIVTSDGVVTKYDEHGDPID